MEPSSDMEPLVGATLSVPGYWWNNMPASERRKLFRCRITGFENEKLMIRFVETLHNRQMRVKIYMVFVWMIRGKIYMTYA